MNINNSNNKANPTYGMILQTKYDTTFKKYK